MLSERAGKWSFWIMFIGFNLTFFPMHQLGLMGSWRRAGRGYPRDDNNVVSRAEFMAFGGLTLSALFFAAIIAQEIPTWIVDACA